MNQPLKSPFPWFGGKRRVARLIWEAFGDVDHYVEPFAGSLAVLLERPAWHRAVARKKGAETVNDADAFLSNFWRALAADPGAVAEHCDWPVNECVPLGTRIATPHGSIAVEEIRHGMVVWGERDGQVVPTMVIAVQTSGAHDFIGVGPLVVTPNHPLWTETGYVEAGSLAGGTEVAVLLGGERDVPTLGRVCLDRSADARDAIRRRDISQTPAVRTSVEGEEGRHEGQNTSSVAESRDERMAPYARGDASDCCQRHGARAHGGNPLGHCGVGAGTGHVASHRGVGGGESRPSPECGTQGEDRGGNIQPQGGRVYRDGKGVPVGNQTRYDVHGFSLSSAVDVFNFQTDTGNYFAEGVLVHNCDLVARHLWLVNEGRARIAKMETDPDVHDAKVAGWWVWGINQWIGSGWCSGAGPWIAGEDGLVKKTGDDPGVNRKLPHLGDAGRGVNRQLPHLGTAGQGVNRKLPGALDGYFASLASRLRRVRVCCGDWSRVVTGGALSYGGTVGVFLDPPYLGDVRTSDLYRVDDHWIANAVREWALANGDDKRLRIVLAGYEPEHEAHMPPSWRRIAYSARKAYGTTSAVGSGEGNDANRHLERLWLSPGCLQRQRDLFDAAG